MGRDTDTTAAAMAMDITADTHPRTTADRITADMPPHIAVIDIVGFTAPLMPIMVDHGTTVATDGIGTIIATGENI